MNIPQIGNKADQVIANIKSDEASITIKSGGPVYLQLDTVDDGLAVLSAESLAAADIPLFYGLALSDIGPAVDGQSLVFGVHNAGRIVLATRAATTDVWASYSAGAVGDIMTVVTATGTIQALIRAGANTATTNAMIHARLAGTYASATTIASSLGGSASLFSTATAKIFLRAM